MIKSLALIISKSTVIFLYLFSYCPEVRGQNVTLDPSGVGSVSPCSSGLRDGDFFIFRGVVDATNGFFTNFVDFQIKKTSDNDFSDLCSASIINCITPNPQACYCAEKNGNVYKIVANRTAYVSFSNADFRIIWKNSPDINVTSNTLKLPTIYDVNAVNDAKTSLTLDDVSVTCPMKVLNGSNIKYQCVDSPSPCDVTISVNNKEAVKGEHNVMYTISTNLTLNAEYNFTFSYSVCGGAIQSDTCSVIREDVITTSPTSSTAVTNGTTSTNTGTTVTVPTTNSTTAPFVSNLQCSLSCEDWAIALSVIFFVAILVIISTGITILVEVIKRDKKTVAFYLCIGFLVFAEVLDIILLIVFAQADPCKCDPQPGIDLALWKIMLIIFCIMNGLLIIATVAVLIWIFAFEKEEHDTGSNSPEIIPTTTTNTANTRKQSNHKNNNGQNATHLSNGKKDKEKSDEEHEMWQSKKELPKLPNTPDEPKKGEAETQASEVKKLKKKKSSKRKKATKEHVEESSSPNRPLPNLKTPESRNPNDLHPQAPAGTTMPNPYANAKK